MIKEAGINDHVVAQYQSAYEKFENPNQLLLKEISNICAKKNLVILEFQKQALEAEKERRLTSKLNMSSCLEKKVKDDKTSHQQHSKALAKEMTWEGETFNE